VWCSMLNVVCGAEGVVVEVYCERVGECLLGVTFWVFFVAHRRW